MQGLFAGTSDCFLNSSVAQGPAAGGNGVVGGRGDRLSIFNVAEQGGEGHHRSVSFLEIVLQDEAASSACIVSKACGAWGRHVGGFFRRVL